MVDNKLSIIGIRSKSTSNSPTYFFSVESENLNTLKVAEKVVKQSLWVHGLECSFERRYHD